MNNCYIASKRLGGGALAYYIINIPEYNTKGHYHQSLSLGYFTNRELNRFYDMYRGLKPYSIWYSIKSKYEFDLERDNQLKSNFQCIIDLQKELDNLPHIVCNGVWDFYEKIGYDRKTKKY